MKNLYSILTVLFYISLVIFGLNFIKHVATAFGVYGNMDLSTPGITYSATILGAFVGSFAIPFVIWVVRWFVGRGIE